MVCCENKYKVYIDVHFNKDTNTKSDQCFVTREYGTKYINLSVLFKVVSNADN